jgi:hypothetical protein
MLVLDHVPAEDLNSGKLCFGPTGELLMNMFEYLQNTFPIKFSLEEMDLRVINFNLFRTYGKTEAFQAEAEEFFGSVMKEKIVDYAPDYVITFGPKPFKHLNDDKIIFAKGNYQNWYGVTIETTLKHKKNKVTFQHIPNISLNSVLNGKTIRSSSYLLGYVSRCMLPAFQGGMRYKIKDPGYGENRDYELIYVDTLSKLDRALKECRKAKYVAIDTEAENLNRIVNMMQTLQLAPSAKRCYVIPIFHRDSPKKHTLPKGVMSKLNNLDDYVRQENEEQQRRALGAINAVAGLLPSKDTPATGSTGSFADSKGRDAGDDDLRDLEAKREAASKPSAADIALDDELDDLLGDLTGTDA